MIGKFVDGLTVEQENRLLTRPFGGYKTANTGIPLCLVEVAYGKSDAWFSTSVWINYDSAINRFGEVRVNQAIRNRILSNRAKRVLNYTSHELFMNMEVADVS